MATETRPPRPETDEDLLSRAPAHDGVATQRDLRETERYLVARFDARFDAKFNGVNAKLDRLTWLTLAWFIVISALLIAIAFRI